MTFNTNIKDTISLYKSVRKFNPQLRLKIKVVNGLYISRLIIQSKIVCESYGSSMVESLYNINLELNRLNKMSKLINPVPFYE